MTSSASITRWHSNISGNALEGILIKICFTTWNRSRPEILEFRVGFIYHPFRIFLYSVPGVLSAIRVGHLKITLRSGPVMPMPKFGRSG